MLNDALPVRGNQLVTITELEEREAKSRTPAPAPDVEMPEVQAEKIASGETKGATDEATNGAYQKLQA